MKSNEIIFPPPIWESFLKHSDGKEFGISSLIQLKLFDQIKIQLQYRKASGIGLSMQVLVQLNELKRVYSHGCKRYQKMASI